MPGCRSLKLIAVFVLGAICGGLLISRACAVQGGNPWSFILVGPMTGGVVAVACICKVLRLQLVGGICGAFASLAFFQGSVCDGSYLAMPVIGAVSGLAVFGVAQDFLASESSRQRAESMAGKKEVESKHNIIHTRHGQPR